MCCVFVGDRGGERRQPAVLEVDDAVGDVEDAVVVRDQQHGDALLLGQIVHQVDHVAAGLLVERRGGLVGEDDARPPGERAGDRDALLLPARELAREVRAARCAQADRFEHLDGALTDLLARQLAVQVERHLHVLRRGQRGEQIVRLEDVADAACAPGRRRARWRR